MSSRATLLPGIATALLVMLAGFWLADVLGHALMAAQGLSGGSPISGVPVAIVLGLLLRNLLPLPSILTPGLKFCVTTVLRLGIVLVGIRLSAFDVMRLGLAGLPVVLAAVITGLSFVTWFNRRLGLPPRLGTLIANLADLVYTRLKPTSSILRALSRDSSDELINSFLVATDRFSWIRASRSSPMRLRQRVSDEQRNTSPCCKNSSPQKYR